jgi:hypothetical protein
MAKKKVDYNIEYAHIYADEDFNSEQKESIKVLDLVVKIIKQDNKTYSLNLMIDEYHPSKKKLNVQKFLTKLKKNNYYPDYLCMESDLHQHVDFLLDNITKSKYKKDYEKYINKNGKSPCSYLAALWYLARLGVLPLQNLKGLRRRRSPFAGRRIINILHSKYKPTEDKALELLHYSKFKKHLDNIIYYYY